MPLQRQFIGLQDHIGSYRGGNITAEISPELQQQISAEDFINPYELIESSATLTAQGQSVVITCPDGEFWRIRFLGLSFLSATANHQLQPVFISRIQTYGLGPIQDTFNLSVGGNRWITGMQFPQGEGFLLRAGEAIGGLMNKYGGAGNLDCDVGIHRQRIKI